MDASPQLCILMPRVVQHPFSGLRQAPSHARQDESDKWIQTWQKVLLAAVGGVFACFCKFSQRPALLLAGTSTFCVSQCERRLVSRQPRPSNALLQPLAACRGRPLPQPRAFLNLQLKISEPATRLITYHGSLATSSGYRMECTKFVDFLQFGVATA